jgi:hypothetical protein
MELGRTHAIAVVATCAGAVAVTGGLALARSGDDPPVARSAQAGTPPAAYAKAQGVRPRNVPAGSFRRVIAFRIPSGEYLVVARATLATKKAAGADCRLRGGSQTIDSASQDLSPAPSSGTRSTVNLQFTGETGGVVELSCRAGAVWFASDSKLTAVAVTLLDLPS